MYCVRIWVCILVFMCGCTCIFVCFRCTRDRSHLCRRPEPYPDSLVGERFTRTRCYCLGHCLQSPREAQEGSFTKMGGSPDEEPPLPPQPEHASKTTGQTLAGHARQRWYHITNYSSRARDPSSRRRTISPVASQDILPCFFPMPHLKKESPKARNTRSSQ